MSELLQTDFVSPDHVEPVDAGTRLLTAQGNFRINYEDGTIDDRRAYIRQERLVYEVTRAAIPSASGSKKARIQLDGPVGMTELVSTVEMTLHPDMNHYRTMPGANDWFTVAEIWANRENPESPDQYRVTVDIAKRDGDGLFFTAMGRSGSRGNWRTEWACAAERYEIPVNQEFELMLAYSQDRERFVLRVDGENLIDVRKPMCAVPGPVSNFSPAKIYCDKKVPDYVRGAGGLVQIAFNSIEVV